MNKVILKILNLANWMNNNQLPQYFDNIVKLSINFKEQFYSDDRGEWKTSDIITYAVENSKITLFPIDKLAEINLVSGNKNEFNEPPGSPEFIERAMQSDLKYPIIVISYPDGEFIADGNHRLWKACALGYKTIKGYLLTSDDLEDIPKIK